MEIKTKIVQEVKLNTNFFKFKSNGNTYTAIIPNDKDANDKVLVYWIDNRGDLKTFWYNQDHVKRYFAEGYWEITDILDGLENKSNK